MGNRFNANFVVSELSYCLRASGSPSLTARWRTQLHTVNSDNSRTSRAQDLPYARQLAHGVPVPLPVLRR